MNLTQEFLYFLRYEKRWWLLPLLGLALIGGIVLLITSGMGGESYRYDLY